LREFGRPLRQGLAGAGIYNRVARDVTLELAYALLLGSHRVRSQAAVALALAHPFAVQPILPDDRLAAHCDGYRSFASNTIRTASTSGEYFTDSLILALFSQSNESSPHPWGV
jgi:hypothetical protein